ncbi:MAG: Glycerol-3-phosphate dehydrogenase [Verrucomicrobiales bacterium]|nr:Glycerol-3-phosphate dehydrogenase [Verrucomicrobiales bacterium]
MKVTVIGAGAWGTALAKVAASNGNEVTLWAHHPERLDEIAATGRNEQYLPGVDLPKELILEKDIRAACQSAECCVIAVPSKAFREVTSQLSGFTGIAVSVTKGIENESGLTMTGVMQREMPGASVAALSGPTLALEVARGVPAAIVAANHKNSIAKSLQSVFHRPAFRVYTSNDLIGVELGGALKNVIAIAAGMCDGLQFGDNAKAALLTRGIAEMRRLGVACGAHSETFAGLSGIGDLTVTCFSKLSRNRGFGEKLGRGQTLEEIVKSKAIAEGFPTARSAYFLARKVGVETPIINEVYATLYEGKDIGHALHDLMGRGTKLED